MDGILKSRSVEKSSYQCSDTRVSRSKWSIRAYGSIKEALRKDFAQAAEDFMVRLQKVEQAIGVLRGSLPVGYIQLAAS